MSFRVSRTFPFNDIVNDPIVSILILGEREDELFVAWWKDEVVKCAIIPNDFVDVVHFELSCIVLIHAIHNRKDACTPILCFERITLYGWCAKRVQFIGESLWLFTQLASVHQSSTY
jgi:hypothetical protein